MEPGGSRDVVDAKALDLPMLDRMYKKRLKTYAKQGYSVVGDASGEGPSKAGTFLDSHACHQAFADDLEICSRSIAIQTTHVSARRIAQLEDLLARAVARGVSIEVVVNRPKEQEALGRAQKVLEGLGALGCRVAFGHGRQSTLAILDEAIVWYGSIPVLAFAKEDDHSLRFVSAEVAHDLRDEIESGQGQPMFGT